VSAAYQRSAVPFNVLWLPGRDAPVILPAMKMQTFNAVLRQDDGWWIGWVEEFPGVNSQGRTKAELLRNLRSALREAIALNRDEAC
jgi:predicted RNase H-like HicB family nuclease